MLKGKSLTDFTNLFSPSDFQKNDNIILNYFLTNLFKMADFVECNSIESNSTECIGNSNLDNQKLRLNKINEIKDCFIDEIEKEN